jgi:thiamine pyrophosphokinase
MGKSVNLILIDRKELDFILENGDVIGVDGGAAYAYRNNLKMICAIGDFDSIDQEILKRIEKTTKVYHHPTHKDQPDSQLAIEKALELCYDEIHVYGALGGRYDHHHANLVLAYLHDEVILHHLESLIRSYSAGTHIIKKESHEKLSMFTFETAVISITQVEYALDHYTMISTDILGLSNAFVSDEAILTIHSGRVLVYCEKA